MPSGAGRSGSAVVADAGTRTAGPARNASGFSTTRGTWSFASVTGWGVPALKNPLDAWIYQELLHRIRPDVLVEIGSYAGGSTLFFAHLLDLLDHGTVISVDLDRSRFEAEHPRIQAVTGDSGDPAVIERVTDACRGQSVMVVHDGDHTCEAVLRDLRAYADLVPVGSYFVVEDGVVDLFPPSDLLGSTPAGPLAAVEAFLDEDDRFQVDEACERYVLTYNPRGFLKRIK